MRLTNSKYWYCHVFYNIIPGIGNAKRSTTVSDVFGVLTVGLLRFVR